MHPSDQTVTNHNALRFAKVSLAGEVAALQRGG